MDSAMYHLSTALYESEPIYLTGSNFQKWDNIVAMWKKIMKTTLQNPSQVKAKW